MLARIFSCVRGNFGCEQYHNQPIFVGRPCSSITAKEACSSTIFSAETIRTIYESRYKPLEPYGHLGQPVPECLNDSVNHAAAHQRLPHNHILAPLWPVREQVPDGN